MGFESEEEPFFLPQSKVVHGFLSVGYDALVFQEESSKRIFYVIAPYLLIFL